MEKKGDDYLNAINRLIGLGIRPDCAIATVNWFLNRGDHEGLENYIENIRTRQVKVSER